MEAKAYYQSEEPSNVNISTTQRALSMAGGTYLVVSALKNAADSPVNSFLKLLSAGYLVYRGASGYCTLTDAFSMRGKSLNIRTSMIVNAPPYEVYMLWRNLENLPMFMKHLDSVKVMDEIHSHWAVKIPGGVGTIEWDAEILVDRRGEELSWRSVENSSVENSGKIVFEDVNGGQSTLLHINIAYNPPAGKVGKAVSRLLNDVFGNIIKDDIRRFKQMVEGAETHTIQLKAHRTNGHHV